MTLSMYDASIPGLVRILGNLSAILDKAAAHCAERKIDPAVLLGMRLYPDMLAFTRQVQLSGDFAKGAGARLAGIEVPKFADTEASFDELRARLAKTTAFLKTLKPKQLEGAETRKIVVPLGPKKASFNGRDFLFNFALPNFYFHVTTAYAILRHCGIVIGKTDFAGPLKLR